MHDMNTRVLWAVCAIHGLHILKHAWVCKFRTSWSMLGCASSGHLEACLGVQGQEERVCSKWCLISMQQIMSQSTCPCGCEGHAVRHLKLPAFTTVYAKEVKKSRNWIPLLVHAHAHHAPRLSTFQAVHVGAVGAHCWYLTLKCTHYSTHQGCSKVLQS
jgi:hypothetical protein